MSEISSLFSRYFYRFIDFWPNVKPFIIYVPFNRSGFVPLLSLNIFRYLDHINIYRSTAPVSELSVFTLHYHRYVTYRSLQTPEKIVPTMSAAITWNRVWPTVSSQAAACVKNPLHSLEVITWKTSLQY